ncbi:MAG: hypothetical protein IJT69_05145 [Clostridia bacterium]|nr:hypothetical protein [Clostridia bacterium]
MSKGQIKRIAITAAAVLLAAVFLTVALLSVPLGGRASVLPVIALYVTGGVTAGIYLAAAAFFFFRIRKDR